MFNAKEVFPLHHVPGNTSLKTWFRLLGDRHDYR
jgi:hypothetical protein